MPYIFTTSLYPSDKAVEVAKRYLEAITKYPPDSSLGTQVVPTAVTTTLQGIKVIGITEVKKGKLEDEIGRKAKMDSVARCWTNVNKKPAISNGFLTALDVVEFSVGAWGGNRTRTASRTEGF